LFSTNTSARRFQETIQKYRGRGRVGAEQDEKRPRVVTTEKVETGGEAAEIFFFSF
jgi:hypothetical protein